MAIEFTVTRGTLTFHANFKEPMFAMWRESDQLFQRLYGALSRHGMQLNDLRWNQPTSVGDVQLNFYLFNYACAVRVRVDRFEIETFDLKKVSQEQLQGAAVDLTRALSAYMPGLSFSTYVVALDQHGVLAAGPAKTFTTRYAAPSPDGLGAALGSGIVYYYPGGGGRLHSAVTADLSAQVADGLFLRVHSTWDASSVKIEQIGELTREYLLKVFESFGVSPT